MKQVLGAYLISWGGGLPSQPPPRVYGPGPYILGSVHYPVIGNVAQ